MKEYVYFICAALHCTGKIMIFRNYEIKLSEKITSISDIKKISDKIERIVNSKELVHVAIINYQLLREE